MAGKHVGTLLSAADPSYLQFVLAKFDGLPPAVVDAMRSAAAASEGLGIDSAPRRAVLEAADVHKPQAPAAAETAGTAEATKAVGTAEATKATKAAEVAEVVDAATVKPAKAAGMEAAMEAVTKATETEAEAAASKGPRASRGSETDAFATPEAKLAFRTAQGRSRPWAAP